MILLFLAWILSIPVSIFYIKWFNTHFKKTDNEYFKSDFVPFLFMPVANVIVCLVATSILFVINKPNRFTACGMVIK